MAASIGQRDRAGQEFPHSRHDILIDSAATLADFRAALASPRRLSGDRIIVAPQFVQESNSAVEKRLNQLYSDCGCVAGSVVAALAATACAVRLVRSRAPLGVTDLLKCLAEVSIAALVGKYIGLVYDRFALLRLSATLEQSGPVTRNAEH